MFQVLKHMVNWHCWQKLTMPTEQLYVWNCNTHLRSSYIPCDYSHCLLRFSRKLLLKFFFLFLFVTFYYFHAQRFIEVRKTDQNNRQLMSIACIFIHLTWVHHLSKLKQDIMMSRFTFLLVKKQKEIQIFVKNSFRIFTTVVL